MVDGGAVERFPDGGLRRFRQATRLGEICAHGNVSRSRNRARAEGILVSVALCRGRYGRRGRQRARLPRYRYVRQARSQAGRRAIEIGSAVEIRIQVGQIDRTFLVYRETPDLVLGDHPGERIRVLGERQPGGPASALEPGERTRAWDQRARADAQVEWVWRVRHPSLRRTRERAALRLELPQLTVCSGFLDRAQRVPCDRGVPLPL